MSATSPTAIPRSRLSSRPRSRPASARNDDFNGPVQEGVGVYQLFQKNGRRYNAARAYLQTSPAANLAIYADCQVRRVLFEGRRAAGVAFLRGGRETQLYARREVILSAGAFGSPQLLMVSGVGPGEALKRFGIEVVQDAPDVGANLQDHCDYVANLIAKGPGPLRPRLADARPPGPRDRQFPPSRNRPPDIQRGGGGRLRKKPPGHRPA